MCVIAAMRAFLRCVISPMTVNRWHAPADTLDRNPVEIRWRLTVDLASGVAVDARAVTG